MMIKKIFSLLCLFLPSIALATSNSSSLSFAPPASDYSVVFLGNIFGIVDGVLHGNGSQIMGAMFGVFNSAVLALGGIIIMYTLLVSTMNTAQEGEMLGKQWSSIWIPMRSTLGLALLIPKASGYCLMQIFVMWIVVQGVGAADKVWSSALSYLNRGGVIVQSQMNPYQSLVAGNNSVMQGAATILAGQVCMAGLQSVLETQRQNYLDAKRNSSGPCFGNVSGSMKQFCETAVPDLVSTVNVVSVQNDNPTASVYSVTMPNVASGTVYAALNGICGTISWLPFSLGSAVTNSQQVTSSSASFGATGINFNTTSASTLSPTELETAKMSRAIAIQQMFVDLAPVAQVMVNNAPILKAKLTSSTTESPFSTVALQQYGIPFSALTNKPCQKQTDKCLTWEGDPLSNSSVLFNGTEFLGAISDYNGIMAPSLNLIAQFQKASDANNSRSFIADANRTGWIMAGSYFFKLAKLNADAGNLSQNTDTNTGLEASSFDPTLMLGAFNNNQCVGSYQPLCSWLNNNPQPISGLVGLINGSSILSAPLAKPSGPPTNFTLMSGIASSTVYGFINNSAMVTLPNQPGQNPPTFRMNFNISVDLGQFKLPDVNFPCGRVLFLCLGELLGKVFYNLILKNIFNFFLTMVTPIINSMVLSFLAAPLIGIGQIFINGVKIIQQPSVNPVIALANMGVTYINFASDLWIALLAMSITVPMIPIFGLFIFVMMILVMPLLMSWLGIMVSIGFITAYYVPILPYMIFTFASIAWITAVIEAMVASPIVALGVTHPEGHEAFGKGERAVMILMNVFLRPSMMIIGYIAAIAVSYVSVWIINAGFQEAITFIQGSGTEAVNWNYTSSSNRSISDIASDTTSMKTGYAGWAGIYGFFFAVLIYTTMYLIVVQKAFNLITYLPDKVLRWIGGEQESLGQEISQWGEETKGQVKSAGDETMKGHEQMAQTMQGGMEQGMGAMKDKAGKSDSGKASAKGGGGLDGGEAAPAPGGE